LPIKAWKKPVKKQSFLGKKDSWNQNAMYDNTSKITLQNITVPSGFQGQRGQSVLDQSAGDVLMIIIPTF
jgi:hypothetical protein